MANDGNTDANSNIFGEVLYKLFVTYNDCDFFFLAMILTLTIVELTQGI